MLTLDLGLNRIQKIDRLGKVRKSFATYFGFTSDQRIADALLYQDATSDSRPVPTLTTTTTGQAATRANPAGERSSAQELRARFGIGRGDPIARKIIEIFMEGDGTALLGIGDAATIAGKLSELLSLPANTEHTTEQLDNFNRFITVFWASTSNRTITPPIPQSSIGRVTAFQSTLDKIGFRQASSNPPSTVDEQETKDRLCAFMMKHPVLVPSEKNADLLSVFFNAIPALELTRATPVLNVRIFSKKQVYTTESGQGGKLSSVSLAKFLEGAIDVSEGGGSQYGALRAIALANQVTASNPLGNRDTVADTDKDFLYYSVSGMELFQAPQTLVNPDAAKIRSNFLAPPIDPFRPLATIKSFDVDVKSTGYGLISTKQSKLEIVLHDRSRLGEFADFVKPDRFGNSFIEVEYGWSHPDAVDVGATTSDAIKNPFADLLNLTRSIDHYSVVNSSFSFDEVGQVTITLNLMSRGVSEMAELAITGEQNVLRQQLQHVRELAETITTLTAQVYRPPAGNNVDALAETTGHRTEIRGEQMLGAAGDATNNLLLSKELLKSYRDLQAALRVRGAAATGNGHRNTAAVELGRQLELLIHLPGSTNGSTNGTRPRDAISVVRSTINNSIKESLKLMNKNGRDVIEKDAFFSTLAPFMREKIVGFSGQVRQESIARSTEETTLDNDELANITNDHIPSIISLGTIIMSFIAKPLAGIKINGNYKFKEVQVYFYGFNNKAGWMSRVNIAQFPIYTKHFAREYSRYRLQNVGRTLAVSITDFMTFLHDKIVDDTMNPAYGLSALYKPGREGPEVKGSADVFDRELSSKMSAANIGGSSDFQMPMITYDLEASPCVSSPSETILKIHIMDRTSSTRSPLRELLTLSVNDTLSSVCTFPATASTTTTATANEDSIIQQDIQDNPRQSAAATTARANELRRNWKECYDEIVTHAISLNLIEDVSRFTIDNNGNRITRTTPTAPSYRFVGGPDKLKSMIMEYTPHVIYGAMNTTIKQASMATQANAALATINMQRAGNADAILATGEQPGGVPMTIFPVQLSLTTLGCPFIRYSQELFVDFNTNTTADNLYYVNGIQHKLSPGEFTTTLKLTPCDAFPAYRNFVGQLNNASNRIKGITDGATAATAAAAATAATAAGAAAAAGGGGGGGGAHHGQGSRLGHSRAVLSHDPARAAQQQAVRDRLAEESRRAELTPDQRRAEDTRRAEDNQLAANYVMNGNILSNPEAVAARAQQTAAEARTRTAAAPMVTGLSTGDDITANAYVTYYQEYMRRNNNAQGGDFLTPEQFVNQRQLRAQQRALYRSVRNIHSPLYDPNAED